MTPAPDGWPSWTSFFQQRALDQVRTHLALAAQATIDARDGREPWIRACPSCDTCSWLDGATGLWFCPRCDWGRVIGGNCVESTTRGTRCASPARFGSRLCDRHYREVVEDLAQEARDEARQVAEAARAKAAAAVVYYVRQGDYVKIGHTTNLAARLASLASGGCVRPADLPPGPVELLATHLGGAVAEQVQHTRFADDRMAGEWFLASDELLAHIGCIVARRD